MGEPNCPTCFWSQFSFVRLDSVFSISWKIETRIRRHWILFNFSLRRISKIRPISSQRHCFSLYGWRSCFSPGWKARGENEFSPSERSDLAILITGARISPVDVSCYSCHFHRYRAVAQPSFLTVRSRSTFASYAFLFKLHGEEPCHVLFSLNDEMTKTAIPNCVIRTPISHGLVISPRRLNTNIAKTNSSEFSASLKSRVYYANICAVIQKLNKAGRSILSMLFIKFSVSWLLSAGKAARKTKEKIIQRAHAIFWGVMRQR